MLTPEHRSRKDKYKDGNTLRDEEIATFEASIKRLVGYQKIFKNQGRVAEAQQMGEVIAEERGLLAFWLKKAGTKSH